MHYSSLNTLYITHIIHHGTGALTTRPDLVRVDSVSDDGLYGVE